MMATGTPALPIEVDPLIAEAKQRAARRRAALLLLLLTGGAAATAAYYFGSGGGSGSTKSSPVSSITAPRVAAVGVIAAPSAVALTAQSLVAMSFPTARVGFVATGDGRLLRTSDMGRTWRRVGRLAVARHSYDPTPLDFVTPRIGFELANGRLLQTVDGGARWRIVRDFGSSVSGVDFVDPDHGWVTTTSDRVYRTVDGGRHWAERPFTSCGEYGGFAGVSFVDATTGFAECIGQPATIDAFKQLYETTDGGGTWREIAQSHIPGAKTGSWGDSPLPDVPLAGHGGELLFRSSNAGLMASERVGIYLTRNRAHTWKTPLLTDDEWFVAAMSWPSSRVAYALLGNSGGLLRSTDGLKHWHRIYPTGPGAPSDPVTAVSARRVLGVEEGAYGMQPGGLEGTTDGGRTWATSTSLTGGVGLMARGAGGVVWAIASTQTTPTSSVDRLVRSRDGGRTWTRVAMPTHDDVAGLDIAPDGTVFLSTWNGATAISALYRSSDDGRSWQTVRRRGTPDSVQFVSAQQGFGVESGLSGIKSSLVQTLDGGKTWRTVPTVGLFPKSISVLDARHWWLWAASSCHVRVFTRFKFPPGSGLHSLAKRGCTGPVHTFMLRTSDGGAHWTEFRMPQLFDPSQYSFVTPQLGYATSTGGILRTTDGGQIWRWIEARP
jgi:photosystem II stability/assembly factor-like uncharacterized protein